jgi:hypothetical protein
MSVSVKVRLDDQFFKAGSLDAEALSWPTLHQFLQQFLQTRGVAAKTWALQFRDRAGQWHALTDEAQLASAVIDGEKLVVSVAVVETTSTPADGSSESDTRSDSVPDEERRAAPQVGPPQPQPQPQVAKFRAVASQCRRWRRRAVKFMFFMLAALFVYSRIMVCSTASDAGKTEQLSTLLTSLIAPSAFESEGQSAELQRVVQKYGAGAPLTDAEIHLFNAILARHESALQRAAAFDRQAEEFSSCAANLIALVERERELVRQVADLKERADGDDVATSLSKVILEKALKFGERAKSHANELLDGTRKSVVDALRKLQSDDDDDDDGTRHTKKTKKTRRWHEDL